MDGARLADRADLGILVGFLAFGETDRDPFARVLALRYSGGEQEPFMIKVTGGPDFDPRLR